MFTHSYMMYITTPAILQRIDQARGGDLAPSLGGRKKFREPKKCLKEIKFRKNLHFGAKKF